MTYQSPNLALDVNGEVKIKAEGLVESKSGYDNINGATKDTCYIAKSKSRIGYDNDKDTVNGKDNSGFESGKVINKDGEEDTSTDKDLTLENLSVVEDTTCINDRPSCSSTEILWAAHSSDMNTENTSKSTFSKAYEKDTNETSQITKSRNGYDYEKGTKGVVDSHDLPKSKSCIRCDNGEVKIKAEGLVESKSGYDNINGATKDTCYIAKSKSRIGYDNDKDTVNGKDNSGFESGKVINKDGEEDTSTDKDLTLENLSVVEDTTCINDSPSCSSTEILWVAHSSDMNTENTSKSTCCEGYEKDCECGFESGKVINKDGEEDTSTDKEKNAHITKSRNGYDCKKDTKGVVDSHDLTKSISRIGYDNDKVNIKGNDLVKSTSRIGYNNNEVNRKGDDLAKSKSCIVSDDKVSRKGYIGRDLIKSKSGYDHYKDTRKDTPTLAKSKSRIGYDNDKDTVKGKDNSGFESGKVINKDGEEHASKDKDLTLENLSAVEDTTCINDSPSRSSTEILWAAHSSDMNTENTSKSTFCEGYEKDSEKNAHITKFRNGYDCKKDTKGVVDSHDLTKSKSRIGYDNGEVKIKADDILLKSKCGYDHYNDASKDTPTLAKSKSCIGYDNDNVNIKGDIGCEILKSKSGYDTSKEDGADDLSKLESGNRCHDGSTYLKSNNRNDIASDDVNINEIKKACTAKENACNLHDNNACTDKSKEDVALMKMMSELRFRDVSATLVKSEDNSSKSSTRNRCEGYNTANTDGNKDVTNIHDRKTFSGREAKKEANSKHDSDEGIVAGNEDLASSNVDETIRWRCSSNPSSKAKTSIDEIEKHGEIENRNTDTTADSKNVSSEDFDFSGECVADEVTAGRYADVTSRMKVVDAAEDPVAGASAPENNVEAACAPDRYSSFVRPFDDRDRPSSANVEERLHRSCSFVQPFDDCNGPSSSHKEEEEEERLHRRCPSDGAHSSPLAAVSAKSRDGHEGIAVLEDVAGDGIDAVGNLSPAVSAREDFAKETRTANGKANDSIQRESPIAKDVTFLLKSRSDVSFEGFVAPTKGTDGNDLASATFDSAGDGSTSCELSADSCHSVDVHNCSGRTRFVARSKRSRSALGELRPVEGTFSEWCVSAVPARLAGRHRWASDGQLTEARLGSGTPSVSLPPTRKTGLNAAHASPTGGVSGGCCADFTQKTKDAATSPIRGIEMRCVSSLSLMSGVSVEVAAVGRESALGGCEDTGHPSADDDGKHGGDGRDVAASGRAAVRSDGTRFSSVTEECNLSVPSPRGCLYWRDTEGGERLDILSIPPDPNGPPRRRHDTGRTDWTEDTGPPDRTDDLSPGASFQAVASPLVSLDDSEDDDGAGDGSSAEGTFADEASFLGSFKDGSLHEGLMWVDTVDDDDPFVEESESEYDIEGRTFLNQSSLEDPLPLKGWHLPPRGLLINSSARSRSLKHAYSDSKKGSLKHALHETSPASKKSSGCKSVDDEDPCGRGSDEENTNRICDERCSLEELVKGPNDDGSDTATHSTGGEERRREGSENGDGPEWLGEGRTDPGSESTSSSPSRAPFTAGSLHLSAYLRGGGSTDECSDASYGDVSLQDGSLHMSSLLQPATSDCRLRAFDTPSGTTSVHAGSTHMSPLLDSSLPTATGSTHVSPLLDSLLPIATGSTHELSLLDSSLPMATGSTHESSLLDSSLPAATGSTHESSLLDSLLPAATGSTHEASLLDSSLPAATGSTPVSSLLDSSLSAATGSTHESSLLDSLLPIATGSTHESSLLDSSLPAATGSTHEASLLDSSLPAATGSTHEASLLDSSLSAATGSTHESSLLDSLLPIATGSTHESSLLDSSLPAATGSTHVSPLLDSSLPTATGSTHESSLLDSSLTAATGSTHELSLLDSSLPTTTGSTHVSSPAATGDSIVGGGDLAGRSLETRAGGRETGSSRRLESSRGAHRIGGATK